MTRKTYQKIANGLHEAIGYAQGYNAGRTKALEEIEAEFKKICVSKDGGFEMINGDLIMKTIRAALKG